MEYLKIQKEEEKKVKAVPNPNMIKELKDLSDRKNRSSWEIFSEQDGMYLTYENYEEAKQAIKAKYRHPLSQKRMELMEEKHIK